MKRIVLQEKLTFLTKNANEIPSQYLFVHIAHDKFYVSFHYYCASLLIFSWGTNETFSSKFEL